MGETVPLGVSLYLLVRNQWIPVEVEVPRKLSEKLGTIDREMIARVARELCRPDGPEAEESLLRLGRCSWRLTEYRVIEIDDFVAQDKPIFDIGVLPGPEDDVEKIEIPDEGGGLAAWGIVIDRCHQEFNIKVLDAVDVFLTDGERIYIMQFR